MSKLVAAVRPYSYKHKTQIILVTSILFVLLIALAGAYAWFSYLMRTETADDEYTVALKVLELNERTDLPLDEVIGMVSTDDIVVTSVDISQIMLNDNEMNQLQSRTILAFYGSNGTVPVTFVMTDQGIVQISSRKQGVLFFASFQRTVMMILMVGSLFAVASLLSSGRIARPISQLTVATHKISEGDFSVRLPQDNGDELGALMHSFNKMTDSLERTSTQQKDFVAAVSHEFKTPIATIKGYARLLQMPDLDEATRKEYLDMIVHETDRLSRLSVTMLRLSALEKQAAPTEITGFDLAEQIRQVILHQEPIWSSRQISFDLELDEITIISDSELLNQVWTNLIQNAIKFSDDNTVIGISLHLAESGKTVECAITDHGIGMTPQTVDRIFELFYQGDRSRSRDGVGLGLNLVQRILNILGGSIRVTSAPGKGSTFTVSIPKQVHTPKA